MKRRADVQYKQEVQLGGLCDLCVVLGAVRPADLKCLRANRWEPCGIATSPCPKETSFCSLVQTTTPPAQQAALEALFGLMV